MKSKYTGFDSPLSDDTLASGRGKGRGSKLVSLEFPPISSAKEIEMTCGEIFLATNTTNINTSSSSSRSSTTTTTTTTSSASSSNSSSSSSSSDEHVDRSSYQLPSSPYLLSARSYILSSNITLAGSRENTRLNALLIENGSTL